MENAMTRTLNRQDVMGWMINGDGAKRFLCLMCSVPMTVKSFGWCSASGMIWANNEKGSNIWQYYRMTVVEEDEAVVLGLQCYFECCCVWCQCRRVWNDLVLSKRFVLFRWIWHKKSFLFYFQCANWKGLYIHLNFSDIMSWYKRLLIAQSYILWQNNWNHYCTTCPNHVKKRYLFSFVQISGYF